MKPNAKLRVVHSSGAARSREFAISHKDSASLMVILRDTLYTDKHKAVLREYSANAWDSHQECGKGDVPIHVTLPTPLSPTLAIRDFGPGLSREDVFEVYTQYGASTKRGSNKAVGMMGIGCKSAFCYSDSFTITSWCDGVKSIYSAVLDASEKGSVSLMHEEPCAPEETGVLIEVPVRPEDISTFEEKAREFYRYFLPRPTINTEVPPLPEAQTTLKHGVIYGRSSYGERWVGVMGCVPYRIDLSQLRGFEGGVADFIDNLFGAVYFDIGEVEVNASREELKYTDQTKHALVQKFGLLVDEYVAHSLETIELGNYTPFERRWRTQVLAAMRLPLPKHWQDIGVSTFTFDEAQAPRTFTLYRGKSATLSIGIKERSRLLLRDTRRTLHGYRLNPDDLLVVPQRMHSWDAIRKELDALLAKHGLQGIPIVPMSTMQWEAPRTINGKEVNPKHRKRFFKLTHTYHSQYSKNWDVVDRVPEDSDVFVILSHFCAQDVYQFYDRLREDKAIADFFKLELPDIYGYKTSEKRPLTSKDCKGVHYPDWREKWLDSLMTPKLLRLLELAEWRDVMSVSWSANRKQLKAIYHQLKERLGRMHPLTHAYRRYLAARLLLWKQGKLKEAVKVLESHFSTSKARPPTAQPVSEKQRVLAELQQYYPLLFLPNTGLHQLWGEHAELWANYVKLVDAKG